LVFLLSVQEFKMMIRKNILGASVAALVLATASSAFAADLPAVAPYQAVAPAGYYDWTGFYVGVQAGYAFADSNLGDDLDGFVGGVHAGYNYQINNWVLGVEGDIEASGVDASGNVTLPAPAGLTAFSVDNKWLGSVRGRVGYAFDRVLVYATGGVAFGDFDVRATNGGVTSSDSNTHVGWTVGAGVEVAITNNVTARVEYRYTDLGDKNYTFAAPVNTVNYDAKDIHAVRVGVSYKF
jgi:outer membrane immunogenic protein